MNEANLNAPKITPTHYSAFGITLTASEFVLTLGETRVILSSVAGGEPKPLVVAEYTSALSLPPNVVKGMALAMVKAIEVYETNFGKIPADPASSMRVESQRSDEPASGA